MKSKSYQNTLSQVVEVLAGERRRVAALWRLTVYAQRLLPESELREDPDRFYSWRDAVLRSPHFSELDGAKHVFMVTAPFANYLSITDEQILEEVNPWSVVSHYSAMVHHGLTYSVPSGVTVSLFNPVDHDRPPLGILPEEWGDIPKISNQTPTRIRNTKVTWVRMNQKFSWGTEIAESNGVPIYVTDIERTLLDILRSPSKSGGMQAVIQAWGLSREKIDLEKLVRDTERYSVKVLRQRVGYLIDQMGLSHPRLSSWKKSLLRGGSVKLLAEGDYSSNYSEEWNLSLNVDFDIENMING